MADDRTVSEALLAATSQRAEQVIGYLYSGTLPIVILVFEENTEIKQFIATTGTAFTIFASLVIGIAIFALYRRLFGELFLFPIQHFLHLLFDRLSFRSANPTSVSGLLRLEGVPLGRRRELYQVLRANFFTEPERRSLNFAHGELHVLYITGLITGLTALLLQFYLGRPPSILYYMFSGLSFLAAFICDTFQHSSEATLVKLRRDRFAEFVRKYLSGETSSSTNPKFGS